METKTLSLKDFETLLETTADDFPPECLALIEDRDFRYRKMGRDERDRLILGILKRIESGQLKVSGIDRRDDWENGWRENFKEFEMTNELSALTPKFIRQDQAIRLYGDYVEPLSPSFEFDFVDVLRRWLFNKYFGDKNVIYEFGCGSCQHLVVLAEMFSQKKIIGLDWASSSIEIVNKLIETGKFNLEGKMFDLFNPDQSLKLEGNCAVFSVGTMEQLGTNFEPFLQFLLSNRVSMCLHLETVREFYDENSLLDYLAVKFDAKRGYLDGFLKRLIELEKMKKVEILKAKRILFGSLYHDGYSLIAWRVRSN